MRGKRAKLLRHAANTVRLTDITPRQLYRQLKKIWTRANKTERKDATHD